MATSGWLMSGVTNTPPSLPALVTVKVEPRSSSGASVPARARVGEAPHVGVELLQRARVAAAHDRHDQAVVGLHRDAEVVAVEQHDLVALEAGVQLGELAQRQRGGAAATGPRACVRSTPVKSHSSTKVTAGTSRCVRVTCSTIRRRTPRTGMRVPSAAPATQWHARRPP